MGAGVFISVEGIDGAGKSTAIKVVRAELEAAGRTVRCTREPGATELGSAIRALVLSRQMSARTEALLFAADRSHHVDDVIRPSLTAGIDIISDRYLDSSVAYQGGGGQLSEAEVEELSFWATDAVLPDLTILLDLDPQLAQGRCAARGDKDRMESRGLSYHEAVRAAFMRRAEADPGRFRVIDASDNPEAVAEAIRGCIRQWLTSTTR